MKKFETEKRIVYYETDAMGIVHHSNYIRFFEIGRTEMLRELGVAHSEMEEMGIWIPVLGVTCEYKTPAVNDDLIVIRSWVEKLKGASIYIGYEIVRKGTEEVIVTGSSSHGFTDPDLVPIRMKKEHPKIYEAMVKATEEDSSVV